MYGKVGVQDLSSGSSGPLRINAEGGLIVEINGAKYAEDARRGRLFSLCNQAAVAITAALATSYTGLVIMNPEGSGKNVELLGMGYATTVAVPTATAIGLMSGTMTAVTSTLTPKNRLIGGPASVCHGEDSCTIGTPVLDFAFATAWTEATTAGTLGQPNWVDLDGNTILVPGSFAAVYSTAANSAAFLCSFLWREVDE
jgi:hypothetical protein